MSNLSHLNVLQLAAQCNNKKADRSHEPYCFELFRRAIEDKHEASWLQVHQSYYLLVRSWIRKAVPPDQDRIDDLTQEAFFAFWRSYTAVKLEQARSVGSILAYLKTCAITTVQKEKRHVQAQLQELSWEHNHFDDILATHFAIDQALNYNDLWAYVLAQCNNEDEKLIARLSLVGGLKPRQIVAEYPDIFASISEVNRIKRNVLLRLRRNLSPDD